MSRKRGDRFSAVIAGRRGAGALQNFVKWIQEAERRQLDPDEARQRERLVIEPMYVKPFGIDMTATIWAKSSASTRARSAFGAAITPYAKETIANNNTAYELGNIDLARVILTTGLRSASVTRTSRITKLKYKTREGTSNSVPFGKGTGDGALVTYTEIKTALTTAIANGRAAGSYRLSFLPEIVGS